MLKKSILTLIILSLILALAGFGYSKKNNVVKSNCSRETGFAVVKMYDGNFDPETLSVKKCTKVTFKNESTESRWPASNIHPTHGIYPEFDPQRTIEPGKEWSFVFDKVGNWKYHDHLYPTIRGVISVSE